MKYFWLIATLLWFLFSTYLSHQTGTQTYQTSQKLSEILGNTELNGSLRRAAHVIVFLVLALLVTVCLRSWSIDRWYIVLIFLWCFIDEATKPLIDGRHFAWFDVGLNVVGAAIGALLGILI